MPEFRAVYRARLEEILNGLFTPDRIQKRIDEIAPAIRAPIRAESKFRLSKFEQEIGAKPVTHSPDEPEFGINQAAYPYRKFVEIRARSLRQQLDGKTKGLIVPPLSAAAMRIYCGFARLKEYRRCRSAWAF